MDSRLFTLLTELSLLNQDQQNQNPFINLNKIDQTLTHILSQEIEPELKQKLINFQLEKRKEIENQLNYSDLQSLNSQFNNQMLLQQNEQFGLNDIFEYLDPSLQEIISISQRENELMKKNYEKKKEIEKLDQIRKNQNQNQNPNQNPNQNRKLNGNQNQNQNQNQNLNKYKNQNRKLNKNQNLNEDENQNLNENEDENQNDEFISAHEQLVINASKKNRTADSYYQKVYQNSKFVEHPSVKRNFLKPIFQNKKNDKEKTKKSEKNKSNGVDDEELENLLADERLKGIDPKMIEQVRFEILDSVHSVSWKDIAGLHFAKMCLKEIVVWPMMRPDIFTGLRGPPKGLLLFGPPGTGKTMLCKALANEAGCTFFSVSASSLMSKWIGEGEKMVRALFEVAKCYQPSIIFIDEVDSLLCQRAEGDFESSRRMKTEFLLRMDGISSNPDERLLVVGATNRPHELDEAARRRFSQRIFIPLPELEARVTLIQNLISEKKYKNNLSNEDISQIGILSEGYSGADLYYLCREAALGPIREIKGDICNIDANSVRPILFSDFQNAFQRVRPSVSSDDLGKCKEFNEKFGTYNDNEN
ncbi:fidgetin-like protein [Anaeramoeba ignava]|uniref:Fidgetin-like protein n=1 Tax=Anaeramoeba ignava TaxID=1746090 RepID=A0A9Q0RAF0_ANAIG|nr:fidgetin-like protein [Anaeramoeba ignava]